MEKVSQLRFRNVLGNLLDICEEPKNKEEKAILFRIGVIVLNRLRIHVNLSTTLGYDVRMLNTQIKTCTSEENTVEVLWDEVLDLLYLYKKVFV